MDSLYSVESSKNYQIIKMPKIPLLESLGVYQGAVVEKNASYPFGGPVLLLIESREVAVGKKVATQIFVEGVC